jgi:hypothetical protein
LFLKETAILHPNFPADIFSPSTPSGNIVSLLAVPSNPFGLGGEKINIKTLGGKKEGYFYLL